MTRAHRAWFAITAAVLCVGHVPAVVGAGPESPQAVSFGAAFGEFEAAGNANLSGQDPDFASNVTVAYRFHPHLALGLDLEWHGQEARLPEGTGEPVEGDMNLDTMSITLQGVYSVPIWRTRLHLGAGLGLYRTRLTIEGSQMLWGYYVDDTDSDVGTHVLARWDVRLKNDWWLGAEHRRVQASADFGRWTGGEIDVGGVINLITLRKQFDLL